jgi:hypothetical protein
MTEFCITVLWIIRCHRCNHKHKQAERVYGPEIRYTSPRPPRRCEKCEQQLREDEYSWSRTFEITDSYEIGGKPT